MKRIVYIQGIGDVEPDFLIKLKKDLEQFFKGYVTSVEVSRNSFPLDDIEYDSKRHQYNISKLLLRLKEIFHISDQIQDANKQISVLGVIDVDLYSTNFNFRFGGKRHIDGFDYSIISITRLSEEFYERPFDQDLFKLRAVKEAVHELGHVFELGHCKNSCAMRFSKSLAEIDEKPLAFCDSCSDGMKEFFSK